MSDNLPTIPPPNAPAEPLLTVGSLGGLAAAIVACVVAFGPDLSAGQQVAILGVVAALAPFIVALVGRSKAFAPDTVRRMLNRAIAEERAKALPTTRNTGVFDGPQGDGPRELR